MECDGERRTITSMTIEITPEMRERAIKLLTPELEAITQRMRELAGEVAAEFDLPEPIASLWLTDLTRQGMSAVRDREAGLAELAGHRQLDLIAALGGGTQPNYRKKCPNAKEFAETQRVADRTRMTLPVTAGDWTFEVASSTS